MRFRASNPANKFVVGIALHGDIANQFSNKVLAIKSALASAPVNSDICDGSFHILRRDDLAFSPVFGCCKFQNADIASFEIDLKLIVWPTSVEEIANCNFGCRGTLRHS